MNSYICNKCYSIRNRKNKSFRITQCGHIFCTDCLDEGARPCPRCNHGEVVSLELKEPLLPKVASLFIPLTEAIQPLVEIANFQSVQMQIIQHRFHQIDKKYSLLKDEYRKLMHNMQIVTDKYRRLRENIETKNKRFGTNGTSNTPSTFNPREKYTNIGGMSISTMKPHGNTLRFTPSTNQSIYDRFQKTTINSVPKTSYNPYSTNNRQQ